MNRAQLDALLSAGLIAPAQHAALCAQLSAGATVTAPALQLELPATNVRLDVETGNGDTSSGILTGTITAYEQLITSHGMILHSGSLTPRTPYERVKMLRDHNHGDPVGYMLGIDAAAETASFQIAATELARVKQEFDDKLRDGLSVGFSITEYEIDDDWVLHVYQAELYEVSLCAIPAIADAGVTSVAAALATARKENHTMNRAQLAAALAAGTITQAQHDAALAALEVVESGPAAPAQQQVFAGVANAAAGPEAVAQPVAPVQVIERLSLRQINRQLANLANAGDTNAFTLALADIIPADDAAPAFMRPDWTGEAWRDDNSTRPWIDAFGAPKELTALKGKGWKWEDEPEVAEYAGNKTEIPSNEIATAPLDFTAFRIAAGWDVDRAFEDFADTEFWGAFWPAVMRSYKLKSNSGIRTRLVAAAAAPTGTVTAGGVKAVLKQVVRDVRPYGRVNRIFLGDDLFSDLEDLSTEDLPLWLKSATIGLDLAEGTADIGTMRIQLDSSLGAKQVVAFDNRAAVVRERAPFRVQAVNVAKAGIDVGIYSYLRLDPQDTRAIVKRTYVPA